MASLVWPHLLTVRKADFQSVNRGSIPRGVIMFKLIIIFPIWTLYYETYNTRSSNFSIDYGPFSSEQQARWFWLMTKEKLQRNYSLAIILNEETKEEVYIDKCKPA